MYKDIQAVAFDIDGTLYPSWKLFIRMPLYILKNFRVYLNFNKARDKMHRTAPLADFYEYQARIFAELSSIESPASFNTLSTSSSALSTKNTTVESTNL